MITKIHVAVFSYTKLLPVTGKETTTYDTVFERFPQLQENKETMLEVNYAKKNVSQGEKDLRIKKKEKSAVHFFIPILRLLCFFQENLTNTRKENENHTLTNRRCI